MSEDADIGLIGLAVMGQNLVLNMHDKGYRVVAFNRTVEKVDAFLADAAKGTNVIGAHSIEEFIKTLKRPRKVMLMVKAGEPVDHFIELLEPHLEKGDIIIDGGNSNYQDTNRRVQSLKEKGILFVGMGISGGEEGARHGPSIMPGGNVDAWPEIKDIFQAISAKVGDDEPCCEWVGENGAGHYVKMVHNGIEYGDMQIISEGYKILREALRLSLEDMSQIFNTWDTGKLNSYLIEITGQIFLKKDEDGAPLLDKILDVAGQKGTGKWTGISALDLDIPVTLITEAVYARLVSGLREQREKLSEAFKTTQTSAEKAEEIELEAEGKAEAIDNVRDALFSAKIISYTQGFMLIHKASETFNWNIDKANVARLWRGGCIIRSTLLENISEAFSKKPHLDNLLLDEFFSQNMEENEEGLRDSITLGMVHKIPMPAMMSALSFFDAICRMHLQTNLVQAQRDFFGAHTYERIDKPRGEFFHTNWTGAGGDVSSGSYSV
ncbi:MAG: 6-phosphogluconate dehydrogenase, decarboxylating [Chlamydiae bacterium]|nr:6-phosphogluconate dehydrogenase, decarboxylating [Chlamydiota bacterium]